MKNWEKYEKEIREIGFEFAVDEEKNEPHYCKWEKGIPCCDCIFFRSSKMCGPQRIDWLYQEYEEKPKLTKRERLFCEFMEIGWLARDDADGYLCWYPERPKRLDDRYWACEKCYAVIDAPNIGFEFIRQDDTEPWSVEDLLMLEVKE